MSDLPLSVRQAIRDQWESPVCLLRGRIKTLKDALGYEIVPDLESNWSKTYEALGTYYAPQGTNKAAFVTTIVGFAEIFYETMERLITHAPEDSNWPDLLLERLQCVEARTLTLDVADVGGPSPFLSWTPGNNGFWMTIPRSQPAKRAQVESRFEADLLSPTFFIGDDDEIEKETAAPPAIEDEWAEIPAAGDGKGDIGEAPRAGKTSVDAVPRQFSRNVPIQPYPSGARKLPDMKALRRPIELFKATTPYVMIVDATTSPLVVECSHQPSLESLAGYLKTWSKRNANDSLRRAVLKVELHESAFFAGFIDAVTVEPYYTIGQKQPINPTVVLAFIEGVLGYKETHTTGTRWVYKLDTVFEK